MNHTTHKDGRSVIAIGAPGSIARAECEGRVLYGIQCKSENIGWRSYDDLLRSSLLDTQEAVVGLSRWHKGHTFRIVKVIMEQKRCQ